MKKERTTAKLLIEVTITYDGGVRAKEDEKVEKYHSRERNPKDVGGKEKGDTPWAEIRDSQRSICGLMPVFHFFQNIGTEMTKLLLKVKNQVLKYILYL